MDEDATPKITAEHRARIPALLERGPEAYGFRGQVWTCKRVAEVIRRTTTNGARILARRDIAHRVDAVLDAPAAPH